MNKEPQNTIERAADAGLVAVRASLAGSGATLKHVYIAIVAESVPAGEPDAVTAASGELPDDELERAKGVLMFLIGEAAGVAKALGLRLEVFPMDKPAGHG